MKDVDYSNLYFNWLCSIININLPREKELHFDKLLKKLYDTEFTWIIDLDSNRADDGHDLRRKFCKMYPENESTIMSQIKGYCSILEMMISLAIRCEDNIMANTKFGDRTVQWFWGMIRSLGLGGMLNRTYNEEKVNHILETFLNRKYEKNGSGGLFTLHHCTEDLTKVEIWCQLCWFLDTKIDI